MKAWVRQRPEDVERVGRKKAPYIVFWKAPNGGRKSRSCGSGPDGKRLAKELQAVLHASLVTGNYKGDPTLFLWGPFVKEFKLKRMRKMDDAHATQVQGTLAVLEKHMSPRTISEITTKFIDDFVAKRLQDRGRKRGTKVAPATVNKDLRNLRLILKAAKAWKLIEDVPDFVMLREPNKIKRHVSREHFAAMFAAASKMDSPAMPNVPPADYWRAFLAFIYVTGWRLEEVLSLHRDDVDFEAGAVISRWEDAKGKRDELVHLPPQVLDLLKTAWASFRDRPLSWANSTRTIYYPFHRLQKHAGINLPCREPHKHTKACHFYGFHDFKRAFATNNASRVTGAELQRLMKHSDFKTTQGYIDYAEVMSSRPDVYVPDNLGGQSAELG